MTNKLLLFFGQSFVCGLCFAVSIVLFRDGNISDGAINMFCSFLNGFFAINNIKKIKESENNEEN